MCFKYEGGLCVNPSNKQKLFDLKMHTLSTHYVMEGHAGKKWVVQWRRIQGAVRPRRHRRA